MAANTSSNKFDTRKNPMAYTILPSEDDEGKDFVPKPPMSIEKIVAWQHRVLIPFTLFSKLLAFLGPYPTAKSHTKKVENFFPGYPVTMPSAFEERSLHLSFLETPACVFRSAPPTQGKECLSWLNKAEGKKSKIMGRFRHLRHDTNLLNWP